MLHKNITSYILKNNIKFTMLTYFSSDNHCIINTSLPPFLNMALTLLPAKDEVYVPSL